ncbi:MAG: rod-binding protein [Alphaproteobacteria bacterium]|nr:rod-binding protein [Alphaproteobacteria bacterium]MBF0249299.1 rod-binding protein [Alphaproteobacteria bacterium]
MSDFALPIDTQSTVDQGRALPRIPKTADMRKLRETAQDFEAVFLSQMLKPMFDGIETDGPFGGGAAEETWRGVMIDEYGKAIAKNGGIGIADAVMAEMLKMQEVQ